MPLVKKLSRPCKRCGEKFIPTGAGSWICPNCCRKPGNFWKKLIKLQKKVNKENETNRNKKRNN